MIFILVWAGLCLAMIILALGQGKGNRATKPAPYVAEIYEKGKKL